ncbi:putative ribonuclease H domain-containing protein [Arabidopsis thaliana]
MIQQTVFFLYWFSLKCFNRNMRQKQFHDSSASCKKLAYLTAPASLRYARQDAKEWQDAEEYTHRLSSKPDRVTSQEPTANLWTTPPIGWTKCNYDGTYHSNAPSKAGWLLRDDRGTFLGAAHAIGSITTNPMESELQALVMAMQHCWSRGYRKIYFEGDNKEVSEIVNGRSSNFAVFNWIRDISAWRSKFEECKFTWTRRFSNMAADALAKQQLPLNTQFYCYNYIPDRETQENRETNGGEIIDGVITELQFRRF